jgi:hypothetical protein
MHAVADVERHPYIRIGSFKTSRGRRRGQAAKATGESGCRLAAHCDRRELEARRREFVHAVVHNAAGESVPTWINEGWQHLESRTSSDVRFRRAAPPPVSPMVSDVHGDTALVAYAENLVAGQLLCERVGQNTAFLQLLGSGTSIRPEPVGVQPEPFYASGGVESA